MSASLNEVRLIGNLGSDPEVKDVKGGNGTKTVATFRLATNESWRDAKGTKQTRTEWHNIEVWGPQAKSVGEYLSKGRSAMVLGALRTDTWEKDGQKHSKTKIVANRVIFLGAPTDKTDEVAGDEPGPSPEGA